MIDPRHDENCEKVPHSLWKMAELIAFINKIDIGEAAEHLEKYRLMRDKKSFSLGVELARMGMREFIRQRQDIRNVIASQLEMKLEAEIIESIAQQNLNPITVELNILGRKKYRPCRRFAKRIFHRLNGIDSMDGIIDRMNRYRLVRDVPNSVKSFEDRKMMRSAQQALGSAFAHRHFK